MSDTTIRRFEDTASPGATVRGYLHAPPNPVAALVLAHGAGSNCESPLLQSVASAIAATGIAVLRCDLPFRQLRPTGPPVRGSAARDQLGLGRAVQVMRALVPGCPLYLGGHSYGGRQSSMLAASDPRLVDALLLFSYPLHPPKRPDELRSAHFPNLHTPALFVHGSRDGFGTLDELASALKLIPARTQLLPIPSAGHELLTARNRSELPAAIAAAFAAFVTLSPAAIRARS